MSESSGSSGTIILVIVIIGAILFVGFLVLVGYLIWRKVEDKKKPPKDLSNIQPGQIFSLKSVNSPSHYLTGPTECCKSLVRDCNGAVAINVGIGNPSLDGFKRCNMLSWKLGTQAGIANQGWISPVANDSVYLLSNSVPECSARNGTEVGTLPQGGGPLWEYNPTDKTLCSTTLGVNKCLKLLTAGGELKGVVPDDKPSAVSSEFQWQPTDPLTTTTDPVCKTT